MNTAIQGSATYSGMANTPVRTKAEKAAGDFEAILLSSLLEKLQTTFAGTREDDPSGSGNYAVMGTQALASAMAARGGIGIARMLLQQWQTKVPDLSRTRVPSGG
jgi:Rod binding domain-containing protein